MRHARKLASALTGLAIALGALASSAATAAPAPSPAASPNHQFCFTSGRGLCMATRHPGINSAIVLRINARSRPQAISWHTGRLRIDGFPGQCVGANRSLTEARSAHCTGGHGIRWRRIVFPFRGVGFENVAATRADPSHTPHYLLAAAQAPGAILAIGTNLELPHVWRDCAGHCTRPAAAPHARRHVGIFGQGGDCNPPTLRLSRLDERRDERPVFAWSGHLVCDDLPTKITSFMTFQKQVRRPHLHWELQHVTPTHSGVTLLTSGLWIKDIWPGALKCQTGRFRINWVSHGLSSTGNRSEGSYCSDPLRSATCAPNAQFIIVHGHHKCPNPLTS